MGGQARQFQVSLNPNAMAAYRVTIDKVIGAVKAGQQRGRRPAGANTAAGSTWCAGRGYARTTQDLAGAVLKAENGTPVRLGDMATVTLGPEIRRGLADLDGKGDAVGGIVIMRQGENALHVIDRVKEKLEDLKASLPAGVEVLPVYDRSNLIERAIDHREGQAGGGDDHRLPGDPGVPLAHPLGHHPHRHHPPERGPGLHPHAAAGPERQPHVPGRHRHLHRRAGGRRHRRGGERLQEAERWNRSGGRGTSTTCAWRPCWRWGPACSSPCW